MPKKKNKIEIKQLKNGELIKESNSLHINNPDYLLTFSDLKVSDGIDIIENIIILRDNYIRSNRKYDGDEIYDEELMEITEEYKDIKNIEGSYICQNFNKLNYIVNSYDDISIISIIANDLYLQDFFDNLKVLNSKKGFVDARLNIGQIILIDKALSPKMLIQTYKTATKQKAKFFESLQLPLHISNITNKNDFLVVASNLPEESLNEEYVMEVGLDITNMDYDDERLDLKEFTTRIEDAVTIACEDALDSINLSPGILDYFVSEGILIGDLVEAASDLIDDQDEKLNENLEKAILDAINDINISFLLMSAIQIRDDLDKYRLREISLKSDKKRLYNDLAFGIAIANSIGGSEAVLRFNHYINKKPGIIYGLSPILDSAFAGLIAGAVSKVLNE